MLFNSFTFFVFFAVVACGYFFLNSSRLITAAKLWLLAASVFFYGFWNYYFIGVLAYSIVSNYTVSSAINNSNVRKRKKALLVIGIANNILLLCYFKYTNFFIDNINYFFESDLTFFKIILPLGISFFTFQQIAYLIDTYRGIVKEHSLIDYSLFVSFFPQLIAGPIVHHREMMPQFKTLKNIRPNPQNIYNGLILFSIGLCKKNFLADSLAQWANYGHDIANAQQHFFDAWTTSLAYTFQLYFDFSGYMDMATGTAMILNIFLPKNFDSPYKSISIQQFWRKWHITLGHFLRDYLYIPLGGSRHGTSRTLINYIVVFTLGGLWHGAAWTFVIWGLAHGCAMSIAHLWMKSTIRIPKAISWLSTFTFVNMAWVIFRANDIQSAYEIIKGMLGLNGISLHLYLENYLHQLSRFNITFAAFEVGQSYGVTNAILAITCSFAIVIWGTPSRQIASGTTPRLAYDFLFAINMTLGIITLYKVTEFIYYQF